MKDFIEKILDSRYIGTVVLVIVAIILIIVGYLIYIQYVENQDVDIYSNEVDVYDNVEDKIEEEIKIDEPKKEEETIKEPEKQEKDEKIEFVDSLEIITKGKNVGKALKKDKTTGDVFSSAQAFLNSKDKIILTTDTVVSIDISKLNDITKTSIKTVNAKIFDEQGNVIFANNITHKYDKITLGIDELEPSNLYYAVITITLDNNTSCEYLFKF